MEGIRDWGDEPPHDGHDGEAGDYRHRRFYNSTISTIASIQGFSGERDAELQRLREEIGLDLGDVANILEGLGYDLDTLWKRYTRQTDNSPTRAGFMLDVIKKGTSPLKMRERSEIIRQGLLVLGLIDE